VDRIKRISFDVLDEHKSKFNVDFAENKKALNQVSIIRSKGLKNKVAGYITRFIKKEIREEKVKQDRALSSQSLEQNVPSETVVEDASLETSDVDVSEETLVEEVDETITMDNSSEKTE
jgi:small subunit ribosomal protein S17e